MQDPHPQIIQPDPAIHAPRHDLMPPDIQTADAIPRFVEDLDRLAGLASAVP